MQLQACHHGRQAGAGVDADAVRLDPEINSRQNKKAGGDDPPAFFYAVRNQTAETSISASVFSTTSSFVTPGASSTSFRPASDTSITPRSVMMRSTTRTPVMGRLHCLRIFGEVLPSLAVATCSITTTTRLTPATRSIAPPMPLTILPGIIQLARSPYCDTCMAPRMARLILPPRIMPNESAELKNDEPSMVVTVCLPALIRSASTLSSVGRG